MTLLVSSDKVRYVFGNQWKGYTVTNKLVPRDYMESTIFSDKLGCIAEEISKRNVESAAFFCGWESNRVSTCESVPLGS